MTQQIKPYCCTMNYYSFSLLLGIAAGFVLCCRCQVITPLGNVCIDQQVETQCEVNGSEPNVALTWRVYYADGTQYGSDISFTSNMADNKIDDTNGDFTFERLSTDPLLISRILFTAQSSINGYSVSCQDNNMNTFSNFTIIVLNNPGDVNIHDTFTNSSVNISWTESPSYCNTTYEYNVASSALEENIIMNSTSNSVMVEGLVPSDDQYCVVVTAKDQYSVRQSDESCFIFNVPSQVTNLTLDITMNSACITATWNEPVILDIDGIVVPKLLGYTVSIANSANDYINETELLPPTTTSTLFCDLKLGQKYEINVTSINGIGSNTSSNAIDVPASVDAMSSSSSDILPTSFMNNESVISNTTDESSTHDINSIRVTPSISPTDILVSTSITTSPNDDSNEGGNLSSGIIAAIVVVPTVIAIIVLLAVLVPVGLYSINKLYYSKSKA